MGEGRYVTQPEAAALCGCDYTTIKRRRERGHFPGVRRRQDANGTYEIPLADLVSAGLLDAGLVEQAADDLVGGTRYERQLDDLRLENARLKAQNDALAGALDDRRDEVAFLRGVLAKAIQTARVA